MNNTKRVKNLSSQKSMKPHNQSINLTAYADGLLDFGGGQKIKSSFAALYF